MDVHFYFDPTCPWTWMTSRWLVDVANRSDVAITWRSFSLAKLNEGGHRRRPSPGQRALRVVEALHGAGRNDEAGRFYAEFGTLVHVRGATPGPAVLEEAAKAASVAEYVAAADDAAWDATVQASLEEALERAGPDVGSPVLVVGDNARGAFGPIVSPPPKGQDALRLWDAVVALHSIPTFFELKRGRTGPPAVSG